MELGDMDIIQKVEGLTPYVRLITEWRHYIKFGYDNGQHNDRAFKTP